MNTVFGRDDIELIILDSGSAPNEVEELKDIENMCIACGIKPTIIYLNDNYSIGWNRNVMLRMAHGEYVLSMDNDMEFENNWASEAIRIFESSGADLLGLWNHPLHSLVREINDDTIEQNNIPGNCWFTKGIDLYKRVGWFKEVPAADFSSQLGEDTDFIFRMRDKGFKAYSVRNNLQTHFGKVRSDGVLSAGF